MISIQSINKTLRRITINSVEVIIKAISDDHPDMELAYRLWYEVYIEELKYDLTKNVDHIERKLKMEPNGSLLFIALSQGKCVGTLRITPEYIYPPEFDYSLYLNSNNIVEITKLLVAKDIRKSVLVLAMCMEWFDFYNENQVQYPYDFVVFSARTSLYPYYQLLSFEKISNQLFIHPVIKNENYLLASSRQRLYEVRSDAEKIIEGKIAVKLKWVIRYWWYKRQFKILSN